MYNWRRSLISLKDRPVTLCIWKLWQDDDSMFWQLGVCHPPQSRCFPETLPWHRESWAVSYTPTRMWRPGLNSELNTLTEARNGPTIPSSTGGTLLSAHILRSEKDLFCICTCFRKITLLIFQSITTILLLVSRKLTARFWALSRQSILNDLTRFIKIGDISLCLGSQLGPHSATNWSSEQKCKWRKMNRWQPR